MAQRLVNPTRRVDLYIGGVDYTDQLISWEASDSSANKNGLITTTGQVVLGEILFTNLQDYDRNIFKRGVEVILDVYKAGSSTPTRHPRGLLYVISTGYNAENSTLTIQIGCKIALAALTEEVDSLLALVPITLEEDRQDIGNIGASFMSYGQYVYQDKTGNFVVNSYFDGDGTGYAAAGEWTAVIGQSTLSVAPMLGGSAIPDFLNLTYQVPTDGIDPEAVLYEITEETSNYPITYPGFSFERINTSGEVGGSTTTTQTQSSSSCGNAPGNTWENLTLPSCTEGYETAEYAPQVDVKSYNSDETWYDGPAGQVSRSLNTSWGPGVEVNSQYYADRYAYCKYLNATACNPTGSCPFYGADGEDDYIKKEYTEETYVYGPANEVIKTTKDTYTNKLALAIDTDWRSGIENGIPIDYTEISTNDFIHTQRVVTEYTVISGNINQSFETTYTSPARDSGIKLGINALSCIGNNGIKKTKQTISTKITALPLAPQATVSAEISTEEKTVEIAIFTSTYTGPSEAGPYKIKESLPIPVLFENTADIDACVAAYTDYLVRFIKGDAYGYQVTSAIRDAVLDNYRPGQPFYLADQEKGKILSLRMDATTWAVNKNEVIFGTNGIWIGDSNGTLNLDSNLIGNTTPTIPGVPVPPIPPVVPTEPSVTGGTSVNSGALSFPVIEITCGSEIAITQPEGTGIISVFAPMTVPVECMTVVGILGFTLQPGNLLTVGTGGSIPVEGGNSLITGNPTIIDPDLFAP